MIRLKRLLLHKFWEKIHSLATRSRRYILANITHANIHYKIAVCLQDRRSFFATTSRWHRVFLVTKMSTTCLFLVQKVLFANFTHTIQYKIEQNILTTNLSDNKPMTKNLVSCYERYWH